MKSAAIYVRVSTGLQAVDGSSLETQQDLCINKCLGMGFTLNELKVYREEGFTGEDIERPEMSRLRDDVAEGKYTHVVCVHPDRFTRDLTDKLTLCREFEKKDVELVFVDTEYVNTPEGQLFFNLMSSIAQYESAQIKKRTVRGRLNAVNKNKVMPMRISPYGYDLVNGALVVNEYEAKFVKLIFQWYVYDKKTFSEIGNELYSLGVMPKRAESKNWSASSLGKILSSELYIGTYYYNRRKTKKIKGERTKAGNPKKTYSIREKSEWLSIDVPPIIDEGTFELAQQQKQKNFTRKGKNVKNQYLLKSIVRCAKCGRIWNGTTYPSKKGGEMMGYPVYRCPNKYPKKYGGDVERCPAPTIRADILDSFVWQMIADALKRPDEIKDFLTSGDNNAIAEFQNIIEVYSDQLSKKEQEREKIKLMFRKDLISEAEFEQDMTGINKEIAKIEADIRSAEDKRSKLSRQSLSKEKIKESIDQYYEILNQDNLEFEEKRKILDMLVDEIVLNYDEDKDEFTLTLVGYLSKISTYGIDRGDLVLTTHCQEVRQHGRRSGGSDLDRNDRPDQSD
ncbi:putative DNA recombinase [Paenibacillus sp. J23TS9]|uniref:recombinase family protein n=1 Tax=Paenibacillus sp. J23TS9 TaxID=2807193 RepID=UPI001B1CC8AD|nr:recombinase family protein [Paenibacillus sp. J23TS9]GIP25046.1 putative DNA recombinase [Paenibacillus sp. J23TS9]